jgi:hypothetical protein
MWFWNRARGVKSLAGAGAGRGGAGQCAAGRFQAKVMDSAKNQQSLVRLSPSSSPKKLRVNRRAFAPLGDTKVLAALTIARRCSLTPSCTSIRSTNLATFPRSLPGPWRAGPKWAPTAMLFWGRIAHKGIPPALRPVCSTMVVLTTYSIASR